METGGCGSCLQTKVVKEKNSMWYYVIQGNDGQMLESSKGRMFYATELEAMAAGEDRIPRFAQLGVIRSLQVGREY